MPTPTSIREADATASLFVITYADGTEAIAPAGHRLVAQALAEGLTAQAFDEYAGRTLADVQAEALDAVQASWAGQKLRVVTPGLEMEYLSKASEAAAIAADATTLTDADRAAYPLVNAEVGVTAPDTSNADTDLRTVAGVIMARRAGWLQAAGALEAARLGARQAIAAETDMASVMGHADTADATFEAVIDALVAAG